ncbi:hypothetical protein PVAND_006040 [Polypedilum vanderplanki]|uniref:Protein turtle n=1 Tax=Polypedilum vanderplanki TaxID=319348 RepID=A0A9J6C2C7_POLVA|nr:hypothetical protein PVAND_006040 [Polypedilum vanderplanki]
MSSFVLMFIMCLQFIAVLCMYEEYKKPTYLEARVGGYVIFNCPLEFPQENFPIPYHLHWRKDSKLIFAWYGGETQVDSQFSGRVHLVDNHFGYGKASINLTSVRDTDIGWYECKMSFPNRSPQTRNNGTWFHLSVDGGTLLKVPPVNQTVLEYEAAFFHCSVKNPDTMFVTWYKDNELLSTFTDLASRTVMNADGSLLITPTLMTDLGVFECRVKNNVGEEEIAHAFLNVQYKAKVIYAPREIYFAYGQQAILDCHFRSNPPLTNLRWEKDGFLFDPYNVRNVFYKRNGSLFFSEVDDIHGGKYQCTPFNELGTEGPSSIINVLVQHPPEFTLKPKSVYIQKLNDTFEMHCSARDKHTDEDRLLIAWTRKDGLALPYGRYQVHGGNLTLINVTADDRGVYICAAINEAARIETEAELMIETFSPKAPSNLTANSTQDAITIRWTQNYIRPDLKFTVWYRLSDGLEWRTHQLQSSKKYEATIENLEPGREYEFMVLSQDRYNDGLFSKPYRYRTKAHDYEEPSELPDSIGAFSQIGPPRNVSVILEGNGYFVTWEPPEYGQDQLGLYIIRWYLEPEHQLHGSAETRNNFYTVPEDNLDDGVLYSFQVSSVSTYNYEAQSAAYEIVTPQYRIVQAITIGAVGLLILLAIAAIVFYMKRHLFAANYANDDKVLD